MKKILLMLVLALSLAMTGCSSDSGDQDSDKGPDEEIGQEVGQKPSEEETDSAEKDKEDDVEEEVEYTIGIETEFNEHSSGNVHMTVAGKTNLPDGEEIIISVISEEHDYVAADTQAVKDGIYVSEPFAKQGESLPSGEYEITVETVEVDKAKQEEVIKIK